MVRRLLSTDIALVEWLRTVDKVIYKLDFSGDEPSMHLHTFRLALQELRSAMGDD